ncbi:hypothetical protein [Tianweitania sediminis]|jgi:hypothetical protein|uniref:SPW repeat-containing protein n=1 Tax=Tianweitania sediminis TaxID=1502156 RepID=A0A8J7QWY7_9HYPH|nr:hypothetical protein [Tianweitania sediminis]MBP0437135.1 hypothetical protein [Tianweitania sediminis]HEV7414857.1 hypothetical protein [Tianweitania sediminis]
MRFIPRSLHAAADYLVGLLVIALPFLFGWDDAATSAFVVAGLAALAYSAVTDYELGLWKRLPFRVHLGLDVLFVIFMFGAPTLLALPSASQWAPYLVGAAGLFLVFTTRLEPNSPAQAARH